MIFTLLCGCASKEFPDVLILVADIQNQVCARYSLLDKEKLTVKHEGDFPLNDCDGMVGFSLQDYNGKVKPWIREMIQNAKDKPKVQTSL